MQCIKWGDEYALSGSMHLFSQNALANTSHPSSPIRNKKDCTGLVHLCGLSSYLIWWLWLVGLFIWALFWVLEVVGYIYALVCIFTHIIWSLPPSLPLFSFLSNICIKKYRKCWSEEICREYESSSGARIWTDSAILMILLFEKLTCFDFWQMG